MWYWGRKGWLMVPKTELDYPGLSEPLGECFCSQGIHATGEVIFIPRKGLAMGLLDLIGKRKDQISPAQMVFAWSMATEDDLRLEGSEALNFLKAVYVSSCSRLSLTEGRHEPGEESAYVENAGRITRACFPPLNGLFIGAGACNKRAVEIMLEFVFKRPHWICILDS